MFIELLRLKERWVKPFLPKIFLGGSSAIHRGELLRL